MNVFSLLFPAFCVGCGWPGRPLCFRCESQIRTTSPLLNDLPGFDLSVVAGTHHFPLTNLVHQFKYGQVRYLSQVCAKLIFRQWRHLNLPPPDLLVATPMHIQKRRERGFNQSELMAAELSKLMNRPWHQLLLKVKNTTHQASLNRQQRLQNLKQTVVANPKYLPRLKPNLNIAVIDDVITTGATLTECAQALNLFAPKQLSALAICYAPKANGNTTGKNAPNAL